MNPDAVMIDDVDPRRHMLSTQRHHWNEDDQSIRDAVSFLEQVAASRQSLQPQQDGEPARGVELTGAEILVAASLLRELSARLRFDLGRGQVSAEAEQLALLSDELVERFYAAADLRG